MALTSTSARARHDAYLSASRREREPQGAFQKLIQGHAGKLLLAVAVAVPVGSYFGVHKLRADAWEQDARVAYASVQGAQKAQAREQAIFVKRFAASGAGLELLATRKEPLEFILNERYEDLAQQRASLGAGIEKAINGSAKSERDLSELLAQRQAGLGSSDFIDQAKGILGEDFDAKQKRENWSQGKAPGFASIALERMSQRFGQLAQASDTRVAQLRKDVAAHAGSFTESVADKAKAKMLDAIGAEASELAQKQAEEQIQSYKQQVKQAAEQAFRRQGESMGPSDWDSIASDLERDPEWGSAKQGLKGAAAQGAKAARDIAGDALEAEKLGALDLAAGIASEPGSVSGISIWQLAFLSQWMRSTSASSFHYMDTPPTHYAKNSYSLTGAPRARWDGAGALDAAQGKAPAIKPWAYKAGSPGSMSAPSALMAGLAQRGAASAGEHAAQAAATKAASEAAARSAARSAEAVAKRSASESAGKAASIAAQRAAATAAQRAAASAATKAATSAATKAAASASSKAAATASSRAAATASSRSSTSSSSSGRR